MFRYLLTFSSFLILLSCTSDGLLVIEPEAPTPRFSLSVTAGAGGTVTPTSGTYDSGATVILTANANSGFTFNSWSNGSTANPVTILIESNTSISASFTAATYSINLISGEGGSVSGAGTYQQGTQVTLSATPNSGYEFTSWSDGSTQQNRTFSVSQNLTLTANFVETINNYSLSVEAGNGGSVSASSGVYEEGAEVTITATPDSGYVFGSWSDGSNQQNRNITVSQNLTLIANFIESTNNFTLSVESGTGGTVSTTGGVYNEGSQVSITATPSSGYSFNTWSNGSTDNPITVSINSDLSITANFESTPSYNITLNANSGGSVSGAGSYTQGTQVTLSATPNTGYLFSSWSDGSTQQNRTISVSQNLTLTANFEIISTGTITYSINLTANSGGSVSGGGSYQQGTQVTLSATPNTGYLFSSWSDGSTVQSRTISVSQNLTLTANFTAITYSINLTANSGGSVSGGGSYQQGTQVNLTATPNTGYTFSSWSDGSNEQNRVISVTQNLTLTANFVSITYTLTVSSGTGGSVTSSSLSSIETTGGTYNYGSQVSLYASPNTGYTFSSWSDGSTQQSRTISMSQNTTITANFTAITYSINLTANSGGSVSGAGSYTQGTQVTLSATPNTGYLFSSWSDGSTEQSRTISVSQNLTLTANFEIISTGTTSYSINVSANSGGTVSGGGSYDQGTQVTLTATPNTGYTFSSWSDGSTEQSRTITVSQDLTLTANFSANTYSVSLTANTGGSVSGAGTYEQGTQVTLTATPNTGYTFSSWSDGSTEQSRTITVSQDLTLTANFSANTYSVSLTANTGGSVSGAGTYEQGTQVTLTATPNTGYTFSSWSDGSTEQSRTISVSQNLTLTANFAQSYISLDSNGVTVKALPGAPIGHQETLNGTVYTIVDRQTLLSMVTGSNNTPAAQLLCNPFCNFSNAVTSYVTDMSNLFVENRGLNQDISSWDVSNVTNMEAMFYNTEPTLASSFNKPIGNWDVSSVTNMKWMFYNATNFNQNINSWDVSNVTNMEGMFRGGTVAAEYPADGDSSFNQPLSSWDVGKVTNMKEMFMGAKVFNQPIGNWDTSSVETTMQMFMGANAFNQPIGNWDVSNVTAMHSMFEETSFNQPIGNWDVSSVTRTDGMFFSNSSFNQPIGNWDVSNVTFIENMFRDAYSFNQDIGNWDVSNVTDFERMFLNAQSFNQDISSWNISSATDMGRMFQGALSFNQDLSGWDLSGVGYPSPVGGPGGLVGCLFFSEGASSWEASNKPDTSGCGG